ncbi:hypothetical protein AGR7B_Cc10411 [Agrobacterium deltaense RV3]|nr:hypothetical protein AGR7B_Cc10411 [Agrobacterium deltaense RV3]
MQVRVVIVDLPKEHGVFKRDRTKIVLAVRVVVWREIIERLHRHYDRSPLFVAEVCDSRRQQHSSAGEAFSKGVVFIADGCGPIGRILAVVLFQSAAHDDHFST